MSGRLTMARASPSFWRCASDSRPPAMPTGESSPTAMTPERSSQLIDELGDQCRDPLRRLGLAVGDLAEDHVLLDRDRDVVLVRVEERDRVGLVRREMLTEVAARREHLVRQLRREQPKPMAGWDQLEGRRQQQP